MKTRMSAAITVLAMILCGCNSDSIAEAQKNETAGQPQSSGTAQVQQLAEQNENDIQPYTTENIAAPRTVAEIEMYETGGEDGRQNHWRVLKEKYGRNVLVFENMRMNEAKTYELSDEDYNEIMGTDFSRYIGKKDDNEGVFDAVYYNVTIRYEDGTEAFSEASIPELWRKFNYYLYECEPFNNSAGNNELCMIGGVVYYNTGETNNVPRCGMLDGAFEVIGEDEYPTKDGQANFTCWNNGFQWGVKAYAIEVCIDDNWYVFKPLYIPSVYRPADGYPRFMRDDVTRITVIPEFQIPMGKEPFEASERLREDLSMLIEVYEAKEIEKPAEELTGGGYIVTVYDSSGDHIEYNFWNEEIFAVDGIYYSFAERVYGENIIKDIVAVIREAEVNETFGEIALPEITPLSRDEDLQIRTDYAAYVSSRYKVDDSGASGTGRLVTADDVRGEFYFGTYDGYKILVMCPSWCYTDDIGLHKLRYTDADIIDPSCDCYPYIDIELPSGMFELLAYKDGTFITVEKALETKLIDYSAAMIIGNYMDAYYQQGNRVCAYNISCWR